MDVLKLYIERDSEYRLPWFLDTLSLAISLSLPLSLSLFVCLSLSLSLPHSLSLSLSHSHPLPLSRSLFVCLSLSLCLTLSLTLSFSLCLTLSLSPSSSLSLFNMASGRIPFLLLIVYFSNIVPQGCINYQLHSTWLDSTPPAWKQPWMRQPDAKNDPGGVRWVFIYSFIDRTMKCKKLHCSKLLFD